MTMKKDFAKRDGIVRYGMSAIAALGLLLAAGTAGATPQLGDDCKACHSNSAYLPPTHPKVENLTSAVCTSCHTGASSQDQTRQSTQAQQQDRDQDRDQTRTQQQRQVRLGGDLGANVLATHAATGRTGQGEQIERYLETAGGQAARQGHGGDADDEGADHAFHHADTHMADAANQWKYRLLLGYLYSSDIEQHTSGSNFGGGDHGSDGDDADEGPEGSFLRLGGRVEYVTAPHSDQTLTYHATLNRDTFTGIDQDRIVFKAGADWKWKREDGTIKIMPYLQRSYYDISGADDRAFWALGLNANRNLNLSETSTLSLTFRYKQRQYDGESGWRRPDLRLGAVYQDELSPNARYRLGIGVVGRNNPKKEDRRYHGQILTAGLGQTFSRGNTLWLNGELGHRTYKAPDRVLNVTRDDSYLQLGLSYTDPAVKLLSIVPRFSCAHRWTRSNLDIYDTQATYCAVLLEKRF